MAGRRTQPELPPTTPPAIPVVGSRAEPSLADNFMYRMLVDVHKAQGATEQALAHLTSAIDKQGQQMGKIDDIRVDVGRISTMLEQLGTDMRSTKGKLDKVRLWIAGATTLIAALVIIVPLALKYLPLSSAGAGGAIQPERGAASRR